MIEEDILGIDASLNVKISSKKSMKTSQVTQLTNEGIDCLSKIRRLGGGTMRLSKEDAANILDALNEWFKSTPKNNVISSGIWSRSLKKEDETIGAKELGDDEIGLDYQRWVELKLRLTDFIENKNEYDPPV